ncbi:hypothetical protein H2200_012059 [Cladophialophora chaetospira]|uniref:Uncharacterized protein n=1 Tax=Cladophialophora chaetospira TaxID=386627 RepID=A0AA38WY31_9EURO|nr:hypothetical protein H2200_012059 [Cladophialophora chaetospira]
MVVIAIVFPILYVAFPTKAQDEINSADLVVTNQSILSPTADTFYLEQTIVLVTSNDDSATLDAWKASLCLEQQCQYPFAEIDVPKSQAKNDTRLQVSQGVQIINMTEFDKYTRLALGSEVFNFYLKGKGKLHKGAWPSANVHYDKEITLKGLNALNGFNVTAFHIMIPPLADGTNVNGTVYMPNPSISAYELGGLALNMSVDGTPIGTALLENVFLGPDNHSFPITAITNLTMVAGLVQGQYQTGVLPVDVVGSSVIYMGQHIPWYEQALGALPLRVDLNITPALQQAGLVGSLDIGPPP